MTKSGCESSGWEHLRIVVCAKGKSRCSSFLRDLTLLYCRWAFLDFHNVEDATSALLDTRNHHLDGRKLVVEYASAEAVRRGGGPGAREHRDNTQGKEKRDITRTGNRVRGETKSEGKTQGNPTAENVYDHEEPPQKKHKAWDGKERDHGVKGRRTKPGAALALAKREKVAIVPSIGKKIRF